ncbi:MAG TPA: tetratricopeptide repeat protein [Acidimicrobiales bacterium]|jgi:tetratricopeptide (TPR) repeat protein/DNA-binding transcriptional ArsR family regulator
MSDVARAARGAAAERLRRAFEDAEAAEAHGGWLRTVAALLVDAAVGLDVDAIGVAADGLRRTAARASNPVASERLLVLAEVARAAAARADAEATLRAIEPGSVAGRLVVAVASQPGISSKDLAEAIGVTEPQVSRASRRLFDLGLVVNRKMGRRKMWFVTPLGQLAVEQLTGSGERDRGNLPGGVNVPAPHEPSRRITNLAPVPSDVVVRATVLTWLEAQPDAVHRVAVTGLPGLGKSTSVAAYVHRHREQYDITWWIRGSNIEGDLAALADRLGAPGRSSPGVHGLAAQAIESLEHAAERWLLVIDDADDAASVTPFIPVGENGRVIVTSRSLVWPPEWSVHHVAPLSHTEAITLVEKTLGPLTPATEPVADILHPLALRLAIGSVQRGLVAADEWAHLGRTRQTGRSGNGDGSRNVSEAIHLAYEGVRRSDSTSAHLLGVLTFVGAGELELSDLSRIERFKDVDQLETALELTADLGFVMLRDRRWAAIHPLVQRALRHRLEFEARATFIGDAVRLMYELLPAKSRNPEEWAPYDRLWTQARGAVENVDPTLDDDVLDLAADVSARLADYAQARALFEDAKDLSERALAMAERCFGSQSAAVARRLRRHGEILRDVADIAGSLVHLQRADDVARHCDDLDVRERFLIANSLGSVVRDTGDPAEALAIHRAALASAEGAATEEVQPRHKAIAWSDIGRAQQELGRFDEAEDGFLRSIDLKRAQVGVRPPSGNRQQQNANAEVARTEIRLGALLTETGEFERADRYLASALGVLEKASSEWAPWRARAHVATGWLRRQQGRYSEAQEHLERGVKGLMLSHGADHHEVGRARAKLAYLLWDRDAIRDARRHFEAAVEIAERTFGSGHPDSAHAMSGLAVVVQDSGNLILAEEYHERAVTIFESTYGPDHIAYAEALDKLGYTLREQGRPREALLRHQQAFDILTGHVRRMRHPHQRICAMPLVNQARALRDEGELSEARRRASEALALLREGDRDLGIVYLVLGQITRDERDYTSALVWFEQARNAFVTSFGERHRDVAAAWRHIGVTNQHAGQLVEAQNALRIAVDIFRLLEEVNPQEVRTAQEDLMMVDLLLQKAGRPPSAVLDRVLVTARS